MKKLMIAAAIVCAAAVSQAAAFQWTLTGVKDHTGVAPSASHAISYTLYAWAVDAQGGVGNAVTLTGAYTGQATSAMAGFNKTTGNSDIVGGNQYYVQMILTDGDWTFESDIAKTSAAPGTGNLILNFNNGTGFAESGAKVSFTGENYGWQNVPEPTSGLLLLLGVAGLALRRRRA